MNSYSYVANNPLKYVDEEGEFPHIIAGVLIGAGINLIGQGLEDILAGEFSGYEAYVGKAASGAVLGGYTVATGGIGLLAPLLAIESGYIKSGVEQSLKILRDKQPGFESSQFDESGFRGGIDAVLGQFFKAGLKISGVTSVTKRIYTRFLNDTISITNIKPSTVGKIAVGTLALKGPGELVQADLGAITRQLSEIKATLSRVASSINNLIQD